MFGSLHVRLAIRLFDDSELVRGSGAGNMNVKEAEWTGKQEGEGGKGVSGEYVTTRDKYAEWFERKGACDGGGWTRGQTRTVKQNCACSVGASRGRKGVR